MKNSIEIDSIETPVLAISILNTINLNTLNYQ